MLKEQKLEYDNKLVIIADEPENSMALNMQFGLFDWFLEFAKPVFAEQDSSQAAEIRAVAAYVLGVILRLLQPVIPFVTDTLWQSFGFGEQASLINAPWPEVFLPQQAVKESYEECE